MTEQELLKLKKEIENAKKDIQELNGEKNYLVKELKETWKCNSSKEADTLIEKMEAEIADLKEELAELLQKIREQYNDKL